MKVIKLDDNVFSSLLELMDAGVKQLGLPAVGTAAAVLNSVTEWEEATAGNDGAPPVKRTKKAD